MAINFTRTEEEQKRVSVTNRDPIKLFPLRIFAASEVTNRERKRCGIARAETLKLFGVSDF